MPVETFKWNVESGVQSNVEYRVVESQFGDGYAQISSDGINTKNESYVIKVHGKKAQVREIMDFFDRHKGATSFFWTTPLGDLGLYTCKDPSPRDEGGGLFSVTGTFVKVFASVR